MATTVTEGEDATTMLSVVIATRGRKELLERTLNSLATCDQPASYAGTIVVENGDQQGAERVVCNAPSRLNATYLFHPDGNKSASLNAALRRIDDGLIVFLDDDVIVSKMALKAYAAAAAGISDGVFFGGPVFPDYEVAPPGWLVQYLPYSARGWTPENEAAPVTAPAFLGSNWAAFVSDLKTVGAFDPSFGPGAPTGSVGQERTMQKRLLDAGGIGRYVPDAQVWHWVPRERCSPRWAFHRMYRDGIYRGLHDPAAGSSSRIFGYPRWAIRRAATHALRANVVVRSPSQQGEHRGDQAAAAVSRLLERKPPRSSQVCLWCDRGTRVASTVNLLPGTFEARRG
jgi:glycosyltransferase involved in cell wall biosynthesis